jgi:tRNA-dihydrouridine synthase A
VLGLFHAVPGARAYRRLLATEAVRPAAGAEVLARALDLVAEDVGASVAA